MRVASFSLNVRSDVDRPRTPPVDRKPQLDKVDWLTLLPGPAPYISLLGTAPFTPAPILSSRSGLPANAKLVLPSGKDGSIVLTPDTLRYLGKTASHLTSQIHEIQLAQRAADARTVLQRQELVRLCEKCNELLTLTDKLEGSRYRSTEARLDKVQKQQQALLGRLDSMLQRMMQLASPDLSETETKWFEELGRMKEEMYGSGKYDETSLIARTKLLEREYERILPALKALVEKEAQRKGKVDESSSSLGFSQAFELGERSSFEKRRLAEMERDIVDLATKLDVTLSKPPTT